MEFLFPAKKVSKCPDCSGCGYIALTYEKTDLSNSYDVEIQCKKCKGRGKLTKRVNLTLDSLKELLK